MNAAELKKEKGNRDLEFLGELNKDLDRVQAAITALFSGAAEGQRASMHVASPGKDIHTVDVETNETPVRCFQVSRNHQGKLFLDGIKEALANRGLVLLGIGKDGFLHTRMGGPLQPFNTSPVQLIVGPTPGEAATGLSRVLTAMLERLGDLKGLDGEA
ncbi:hypothetical protein ABBQ32_001646 [Trebouxia sp. C0010 RCD-2024]